MRLLTVCRTIAFLPLLGLAAGVLFSPPALADDDGGFVCKQELMTGAWISYGNLFGQGDIFGANGNWSAVGLVVFDEQGFATTAIQSNTHGASPSGSEAENFLETWDIQFTVNPDCTGKYTFYMEWTPFLRQPVNP